MLDKTPNDMSCCQSCSHQIQIDPIFGYISEIVWELPDCIHSLVLSDELNELLNSQTELQTALPKNQTKVSQVGSQTLRANRRR